MHLGKRQNERNTYVHTLTLYLHIHDFTKKSKDEFGHTHGGGFFWVGGEVIKRNDTNSFGLICRLTPLTE